MVENKQEVDPQVEVQEKVEENVEMAEKVEENAEMTQPEGESAFAEVVEEQPQAQSISGMVDAQNAQTLQDMGFPKQVAEKALFLTQNKGVEGAMAWIDAHQEDADYMEELTIVGQSEKAKPVSNLTKEEKIKKATELQAAIRERNRIEHAKNTLENEKNRAAMDKEIAAAKKLNEEREYDNAIAAKMAEKKKLAEEKAQMLRILEQDKRDRNGGKLPEESKKVEKVGLELLEFGIKTVKTIYTEFRQPGVAKTCFKTCNTFAGNVLKDVNEPKYQKVNLDNAAVATRVGKINGGKAILKGLGFYENPDGTNTLLMTKVDADLLKKAQAIFKPLIED